MSRAAKIFLGSSIFATSATVLGVHWLQKSESDVSSRSLTPPRRRSDVSQRMYEGVLADEQRMLSRASALLSSGSQSASSSSSSSPTSILLPRVPHSAADPPHPVSYSTVAHSSHSPLNTPSSPVQQPAPVVDPDCLTCQLSPPPEISEKTTKEERAKERIARLREYEDQKVLGEKLEREQGVSEHRQV